MTLEQKAGHDVTHLSLGLDVGPLFSHDRYSLEAIYVQVQSYHQRNLLDTDELDTNSGCLPIH